MMLKTIIWILGWKLKVISNLNSPFKILKHYLRKLSMCFYFNFIFATIPFSAFISVPTHLPFYVFVSILYLPQSFLCSYFSFSYPLLSSFIFFFMPPSTILSLCLCFFFFYFILSLCISNFLVVFLFIHYLLSICWLFSLLFSTLILDCLCMFLFSSLSSLILLFASSLILSKLVYDVTNGPSKVINNKSKSNLTMMNYQ
jgi:hypothetical protein